MALWLRRTRGPTPTDTTAKRGETSVGADQLRYQLATEVWHLALQALIRNLFYGLNSRRLRQVKSLSYFLALTLCRQLTTQADTAS